MIPDGRCSTVYGGVTIGGQPLDPGATYSVAANEFIPLFLTAMEIPFSDLVVFSGDTTEFQVLLQAVMMADTLTPQTDGRVKAATFTDPGTVVTDEASPASFLLAQNLSEPIQSEHAHQSSPCRLLGCSPDRLRYPRPRSHDPPLRSVPVRKHRGHLEWARSLWSTSRERCLFLQAGSPPIDGSTGFTAIRKMLLTK